MIKHKQVPLYVFFFPWNLRPDALQIIPAGYTFPLRKTVLKPNRGQLLSMEELASHSTRSDQGAQIGPHTRFHFFEPPLFY